MLQSFALFTRDSCFLHISETMIHHQCQFDFCVCEMSTDDKHSPFFIVVIPSPIPMTKESTHVSSASRSATFGVVVIPSPFPITKKKAHVSSASRSAPFGVVLIPSAISTTKGSPHVSSARSSAPIRPADVYIITIIKVMQTDQRTMVFPRRLLAIHLPPTEFTYSLSHPNKLL